MRFVTLVFALLVFTAGFSAISAQESGLWEKAFARPHGAILVDEVLYEPERFMVRNQGQRIKVAGKFQEPNLTRDGSITRATIVWGGRYTGVACLSSDKEEMLKVVDLVAGEEVIASGIVDRYDNKWLYLDECTIEDGVTLFHSRDPKFILGAWCGVADGRTFRKRVFERGKDGSYQQTIYDPNAAGGWHAWSIGTKATRVKRPTANTLETAFIGPRGEYSWVRFKILSHNRMSDRDGARFHRCQ